MIRRCAYKGRSDQQCTNREAHRGVHDYSWRSSWCEWCQQSKPAPHHMLCGDCGGVHAAEGQRNRPGSPFGVRRDGGKLERLRKRRALLVQRARALGLAS